MPVSTGKRLLSLVLPNTIIDIWKINIHGNCNGYFRSRSIGRNSCWFSWLYRKLLQERRWVIRVGYVFAAWFVQNLIYYQFSIGFLTSIDGFMTVMIWFHLQISRTKRWLFSYDRGSILRTSLTFIQRSSYMIYQQNQSHQWSLSSLHFIHS